MTDEPKKCEIVDGAFLYPCWALRTQSRHHIRGGIEIVAWYDLKGVMTRRFASVQGVRSRDINAMALSYCPFCGEDISAPLTKHEGDNAETAEGHDAG